MPSKKNRRFDLIVPAEDYEMWRAISKEGNASIARLIRTAIRQADRAKLVETLRQAA